MFAISSYGVRVTTEECSVAVVVMSCQCIVGVIIQVRVSPSSGAKGGQHLLS